MFNKLVGNENIKQTLRHLFEKGRVPNSLLFAGDAGSAKGGSHGARKGIRLPGTRRRSACEECSACVRVDTFVNPEPTEKNKED